MTNTSLIESCNIFNLKFEKNICLLLHVSSVMYSNHNSIMDHNVAFLINSENFTV